MGLDGLKALAIIAIFFYHIAPLTCPGGFIGVDMFLAISGFVICTSLIRSLNRRRDIQFLQYMTRRLKRIFPALAFMIVVVTIIAALVDRDLLVRAWQQVLSGLTFTYNLFTIFSGANYFDSMNARLFNHLWYVGILMQLYIVAPLLVWLLWKVPNRRFGVYVLCGLAVLSFVFMAFWYDPMNLTFVYEGTFTHSGGFLFGMALSWYRELCLTGKIKTRTGNQAQCSSPSIVQQMLILLHSQLFWRIAALVSVLGMAIFVFALTNDVLAFRGGIACASIFSVLIIEYTVREETAVQRILESPPLKMLGRYSYGVYLWHWPLWLIFSRGMGDMAFLLIFFVTIFFTAVATFVSARYVESPKLTDMTPFSRSYACVLGIEVTPRKVIYAALALGAFISLLTAPQQTELEMEAARLEAEQSEASSDESAAESEEQPSDLGEIPADLTFPEGSEMIAIGESVMLFCSDSLEEEFSGILVNAKSGREWKSGVSIVKDYKEQGQLRRWLVFALASNTYVDIDDLEDLRKAAGDNVIIVLVGAYGPTDRYPRYPEMNELIKNYALEHADNTVYADWYGLASQHTEIFYSDGVHPKEDEGQGLYAQSISTAITTWLGE